MGAGEMHKLLRSICLLRNGSAPFEAARGAPEPDGGAEASISDSLSPLVESKLRRCSSPGGSQTN